MLWKSNREFGEKKYWIPLLFSLCLINWLIQYPLLWAGLGIGVLLMLVRSVIPKKHQELVTLALSLVAVPIVLVAWQEPSHAVMLTRLQEFMVDSFTQGGTNDNNFTTIINLIINGVRFIFMVFVAIAVWQGIDSFRQNEEFSGFVRGVGAVLMGVLAIDVISALILPGS